MLSEGTIGLAKKKIKTWFTFKAPTNKRDELVKATHYSALWDADNFYGGNSLAYEERKHGEFANSLQACGGGIGAELLERH